MAQSASSAALNWASGPALNWYPGHMNKAMRQMTEQMRHVHVVLEVRDARLPFSSANTALRELAAKYNKPRLIVLNKSDLCNSRLQGRVAARLLQEGVKQEEQGAADLEGSLPGSSGGASTSKRAAGTHSIFVSAARADQLRNAVGSAPGATARSSGHRTASSSVRNVVEEALRVAVAHRQLQPQHTQRIPDEVGERDVQAAHDIALGAARDVIASPTTRAGVDSMLMMVVGLPNVGKSSLINALKQTCTVRARSEAAACKVGPHAGLTRHLAKVCFDLGVFQHQSRSAGGNVVAEPSVTRRAFLVDTPGIMLPSFSNDHERALKLALIGAFNDSVVPMETVAEYLLFSLNRLNCLEYVQACSLTSPTDNLQLLLRALARGGHAGGQALQSADLALLFVKMFRRGDLGRVTLDQVI